MDRFINISFLRSILFADHSSCAAEHFKSGTLTLHILAVPAADSFTARVADWASKDAPGVLLSALPRILQAECRLDGPYGRIAMRDWRSRYAYIVLACGGVGCTPMMAALAELLALRAEGRMKHSTPCKYVINCCIVSDIKVRWKM
jgi:hypothetical protein